MSETPAIIVVDDDPDIRETLQTYFEANGFTVEEAADGAELRAKVADGNYDLAILDLKMPGEDGLSLCRFLRETTDMGVVMLTGSGDSIDRVIGLEVGADDYIPKPFELREVLARVRSVLRRVAPGGKAVVEEPVRSGEGKDNFTFGPFSVNPNSRYLESADGETIALSPMEFDLIKAFADRPERVLSRDMLLELAHGRDWDPFDRSIDVRVTRLRKKIEEDPAYPKYIKTVRGVGYIYHPDGK
ncbi:MAG: response regulator [Pseudomonadota bacterium]